MTALLESDQARWRGEDYKEPDPIKADYGEDLEFGKGFDSSDDAILTIDEDCPPLGKTFKIGFTVYTLIRDSKGKLDFEEVLEH